MKLVCRWMGLEIVLVQIGHGLLGAVAIGLIASQAPWWFTLAGSNKEPGASSKKGEEV